MFQHGERRPEKESHTMKIQNRIRRNGGTKPGKSQVKIPAELTRELYALRHLNSKFQKEIQELTDNELELLISKLEKDITSLRYLLWIRQEDKYHQN